MPRRADLKKVMLIGSGPIVIGQAAEFDYAGTQACRALREEGVQIVLCNPNPATIMTDPGLADRTYIEPLTPDVLSRIIAQERPRGLIATFGGQTGLNLAVQLAEAGTLDRYGVTLLGTPLEAIRNAEDRERFKSSMLALGEPLPPSQTVNSVAQALTAAHEIGYPVIVRPAYTLGGTGGGVATNATELAEVAARGLRASMVHQVLVEKSLAGWKEIEFEVIRDGAGNSLAVCAMENVDPIGIHTGDSIVVAPTQTLSDREYQMLRSAALRIIDALGVAGGCNVQFALDPHSDQYYVIEVNPRVSRSSALASKATGYPIARVAAKIALGLRLDEITIGQAATGESTGRAGAATGGGANGGVMACFEPAVDYVVVKIPRWPFDKFAAANRRLGTQMKATGEVMAIARSFEAALQKALRSLDMGVTGLGYPPAAAWSTHDIVARLQEATDERLFAVAEAFRRGMSVTEVHAYTSVDPFFLYKIERMVACERELAAGPLTPDLLARAKDLGFADAEIARLAAPPAGGAAAAGNPGSTDSTGGATAAGSTPGQIWNEQTVQALRQKWGIRPVYKAVDLCAAEFPTATPYFYSAYEPGGADDLAEYERLDLPLPAGSHTVGRKPVASREAVAVIGAGPIRIGQGIEFDYCCVQAAQALQAMGCRAVMINQNPETVSTDFDTADALFFEPLTREDVLEVVARENARGVLVQFGGQTALNLAGPLADAGVPVLGTSVDSIDWAEDRGRTTALLEALGIPHAQGGAARTVAEARKVAERTGYPVVVRPSYVIGGRAVEIIRTPGQFARYLEEVPPEAASHPLLIDRYLPGREVEVDAVSDGTTTFIPGIMEHVERAGVHSGDSYAVFPPQNLTPAEIAQIVQHTRRIAAALQVRGLLNIQFIVYEHVVYVLEINPRASRTVPVLSKVTGVPMVALATAVACGRNLADLGYADGLAPAPPYVCVKAPVFSFDKLPQADVTLGPEMKSTGEVLGWDIDYHHALAKAFVASGLARPRPGRHEEPVAPRAALISLADGDKAEAVPVLRRYVELGFSLFATPGTARALVQHGIPVAAVAWEQLEEVLDRGVDLLINTASGHGRGTLGQRLRERARARGLVCLTSLDTARAYAEALPAAGAAGWQCRPLQEYVADALEQRRGNHGKIDENSPGLLRRA